MKHPRGVILDELAGAGVPLAEIHAIARKIEAAYEEVNGGRDSAPADPFASLARRPAMGFGHDELLKALRRISAIGSAITDQPDPFEAYPDQSLQRARRYAREAIAKAEGA